MRSHNKTILDLDIDSLGTIIIQDIDNDYWVYNDLQFKKLARKDKNLNMMEGIGNQAIFYSGEDIYTLRDKSFIKMTSLDSKIIAVHSEDSLLHILSSTKYYKYVNGEISQCKNTMYHSRGEIDFYSIADSTTMITTNKGIQFLCNNVDTIIGHSLSINTSTRIDNDNFLLATDTGLWLYNGGEVRKYYVPGVSLPNAIKKLHINERKLWILTQKSVLYVYDFDTQILDHVGSEVITFDIDQWQTVYLNKGKYIEIESKYNNDRLPRFSIVDLKNGYKVLQPDSIHVYNTDENDIYIKLQSYYTPSPHSVKYQYRLHKSDTWINLEDTELYLIDLPADRYNLQFRATADGQYFTDIQGLEFVIKSPFRNSIWFYLLILLSLLTVMCLISITRGHKERRKLNADKASIHKELSLIKSEHKLNQVQLNPHFLFNALNSIAGMIALNDNKLARRSLNKFAQLMRMALDNSSTESIDINEEVDFLDKYLSLEQMLRNDSFDYNIETNDIVTMLPPMLIQPVVENAIIHGIAPLRKRRGKIDIIFSDQRQYIIVEVLDNGIGIDASLKGKNGDHISKATTITENRLKAIDRWGLLDNYLVYKDLSVMSTSNYGTSVKISIAKKRI